MILKRAITARAGLEKFLIEGGFDFLRQRFSRLRIIRISKRAQPFAQRG